MFISVSKRDNAQRELTIARNRVRKLAGEVKLEDCLVRQLQRTTNFSRGGITLVRCSPSYQHPNLRSYTVPVPKSVGDIFPDIKTVPCELSVEALSVFLPIRMRICILRSTTSYNSWFKYQGYLANILADYHQIRVGAAPEVLLATILREFTKEVDAQLTITL